MTWTVYVITKLGNRWVREAHRGFRRTLRGASTS